jgi:hypothetical protein
MLERKTASTGNNYESSGRDKNCGLTHVGVVQERSRREESACSL